MARQPNTQHHPTPDSGNRARDPTMTEWDNQPNPDEDAQLPQATFVLVLDAHPGQWSINELMRELSGGNPDPATLDAIENTLRDLRAAGHIHRQGEFVFASRAATIAAELLT